MQSPLRVRMPSVLSLLLVVIIFPFGLSQSLTSCAEEVAVCYADDACTSCANLLQGLIESGSIDTDITSCPSFFAGICLAVDTDECDVTNVYLLDFAQCIVEEEFGCSGFTTCEDASDTAAPAAAPATASTIVPTIAPTIAPTSAPTSALKVPPIDRTDDFGASAGVTASVTSALLGTLAALLVV